MRILIPLLLIALLLCSGVINTYHAIRYHTPPVTTLEETLPGSLPVFVTLKDLTFDVEHMMKLKFGSEFLFVPVRAKGAAANSEVGLVVMMSAADLIAAVGSSSPDALSKILALGRRTEVTGRIHDPGRSSSQVESLRKAVPAISPAVLVLNEGATPGKIQGIVMLVLGFGVLAIFIGGGFKKASPPQLAPTHATA